VAFTAQPIVFFGKVGRVASEEVVILLISSKCRLCQYYCMA